MVTKKRPVNLDLTSMAFPITAIVSIFHRVSGFFLFLLVPFALFILQTSLASEDSFWWTVHALSGRPQRLIWVGAIAILLYHFIAGVRHMLMDFHFFETRAGGRLSSWTVFGVFFFSFILGLIWLW